MTPVPVPTPAEVEVGQKRRWIGPGGGVFVVRGIDHDDAWISATAGRKTTDCVGIVFDAEHLAAMSEVVPDPPIEPGSRWVSKDAPEERCVVLTFKPEPARQGGFVTIAYTPSGEPMGWNLAATVGVAFRRDQEPYDEAVHGPWAAAGEASA